MEVFHEESLFLRSSQFLGRAVFSALQEFSERGGDLCVIVGGVGEEEGGVPGGDVAIHFERGIVVEVAGTGEIGGRRSLCTNKVWQGRYRGEV